MSAAPTPLPGGYACTACGKFHGFSAYVFAHWKVPLTHKCECGVEHRIRNGTASRVAAPKRATR